MPRGTVFPLRPICFQDMNANVDKHARCISASHLTTHSHET